jgi:hypothetical protein
MKPQTTGDKQKKALEVSDRQPTAGYHLRQEDMEGSGETGRSGGDTIKSGSSIGVKLAVSKLVDYCRRNQWAGFDPYDALNSRVFALTPFRQSRICRIVFTQAMKRLPINLRPLLAVGKEENAKAVALFMKSFLILSRHHVYDANEFVWQFLDKLVNLRSENTRYWSWGYNFPWQTRTVMVPRRAPNLVCTCFVADALLDMYEQHCEPSHLMMTVSAAEYLLNELYYASDSIAGFSYPLQGLQSRVHNANFLAAALLARVFKHTGDCRFLGPALRAVRYSVGKQQRDGSWYYGEGATQHWIDNFHTGYNLTALRAIGQHLGTNEFEDTVQSGFAFFRSHFLDRNVVPKYFHNRTYPVDIHCVAQSIITLVTLRDLATDNLAANVFKWTMANMWNEEGRFDYQFRPAYKNRIPYMRWSQAWMLLALASMIEHGAN